MPFDEVQFPTRLSYGSRGGPKYVSSIVETSLGYERRVVRHMSPIHSYNVAPGLKNDNDAATLYNFYVARLGSYRGFRFKDWMDFSSAANHRGTPADTDQSTVELTATTYQLQKVYTSGSASTYRKITKPVSGSVVIAVDGVNVPSGWTVDTSTGIVTFDVDPVGVVTAGFLFDVPVRFGQSADKLFAQLPTGFNKNDIEDVPLEEIVDAGEALTETGFGSQPTPLDPGFRRARPCVVIPCTQTDIDPEKDLYLKFTNLSKPDSFPVTLPMSGDTLVNIEGEFNDIIVRLRSNGTGWDQHQFIYPDTEADPQFTRLKISRAGGDLFVHIRVVNIVANYSPDNNGVEIIVGSTWGGGQTGMFRGGSAGDDSAVTCVKYPNIQQFLGDDAGEMEAAMWGGEVTFYQGTLVDAADSDGPTTDDLINLFVPEDEIGGFPYYFQWAVDGKCYQVLETDPAEVPGIVAFNGTRTETDNCDAEGCDCSACGNDFSWNTGDLYEPADTLGSGDGYVPTETHLSASAAFTVCMKDKAELSFVGESDDFVILTASTDTVTETYSGTPGDPVTITLPEKYIIFRDTTGLTRSGGVGGHPATVEKTFTDGTLEYVLAEGTGGGSGHVVDMEEEGFTTQNWDQAIPVAVLEALGWLNAFGIASLKFWHVVSGAGFASVTAVKCDGSTGGGGGVDPADAEYYSTGESASTLVGSGWDRDAQWVLMAGSEADFDTDSPAYIGVPGWEHQLPPQGSQWISENAAFTETGLMKFATRVIIGAAVDPISFSLPVEFSSINDVIAIKVNGADIIEDPIMYPVPWTDFIDNIVLTGFETGENIVEFHVTASGASGDTQGLCVKFGIPTYNYL